MARRAKGPTAPPGLRRGLLRLLPVLLLAAGCDVGATGGDGRGPSPTGMRPVVVTSMSVLADIAQRVAGSEATVVSLVPVGGDPHVHEPTAVDARAIADADLLIGNGAGLEPWFVTLVTGQGRDAVLLADRVLTDGPVASVVDQDPHLWMVPPIAGQYARLIAEELARSDPERATEYRDAALRTEEEFLRLDDELRSSMASIPPPRRTIVTTHDAYASFAAHYGFRVASVIGFSTDEEPSAAKVRALIELVRDTEVPTVFVESSINPALMRRVASDADVRLGGTLYGDSLGPPAPVRTTTSGCCGRTPGCSSTDWPPHDVATGGRWT